MLSSFYGVLLLLLNITCYATPQGLPPPVPIYRSTPSRITATPCTRNAKCLAQFPFTDCRSRFYCQCQRGFIEEFDTCLPVIMDLDTACTINAQCTRGLGPLSRCSSLTNLCECHDTETDGRNATAYGSQRCYFYKWLGDPCDLNEECRASITPGNGVRCNTRSRTCVCEEDQICRNVQKPSELVQEPHKIKNIACNDLGDCYSVADPVPLSRYSDAMTNSRSSPVLRVGLTMFLYWNLFKVW